MFDRSICRNDRSIEFEKWIKKNNIPYVTQDPTKCKDRNFKELLNEIVEFLRENDLIRPGRESKIHAIRKPGDRRGWISSGDIEELMRGHIEELNKPVRYKNGKIGRKLKKGIMFYDYPCFRYLNRKDIVRFRHKDAPLYIYASTGGYHYKQTYRCYSKCASCDATEIESLQYDEKEKDSSELSCDKCQKKFYIFTKFRNKDLLPPNHDRCTGRHTVFVKASKVRREGEPNKIVLLEFYDSYNQKNNCYVRMAHDFFQKLAIEPMGGEQKLLKEIESEEDEV
jgi:hypothetical protein